MNRSINTTFSLLLALLLGSAANLSAQDITLPPSGDNQKTVLTQFIGSLVHVQVTYNSPDVTAPDGSSRKGKIWGGVVPWGLEDFGFGSGNPGPWRAGANENTVIHFSHDVLVEGKELAAGKYGFHIITQESGPWTLVFSKDHDAWGSYWYNPERDALRVDVEARSNEYQEWLNFEFLERGPESAVLALQWEEMEVPFKIEVADMNAVYLAQIEAELQSDMSFSWENWNAAANFCLSRNYELEKGLYFAEQSIGATFIGEENFNTLSTKANLLEALNRADEASTTMEAAFALEQTSVFDIHGYARQLLARDRKEEALEVFQINEKRFGDTWPVHAGLARGYSANGEYKKAIKHAEKAVAQAPDQRNADYYRQAVETLKSGKDFN
jgi:tetratricopeptide (TPR) repeat protein